MANKVLVKRLQDLYDIKKKLRALEEDVEDIVEGYCDQPFNLPDVGKLGLPANLLPSIALAIF